MGGGASHPPEYTFSFNNNPVKVPEQLQVKLPKLKKHDSAPHLIATTTVFCNYVDVKNGDNLVQRNISREIKSKIGGGKLNYRHCDWYEFNKEMPWLLKNGAFSNPYIKDFDVHRTIGKGRTSTVRMARTKNDKFFVVKTINKNFIFRSELEERHIMNEREVLYELNSPFCAKLLANFEDSIACYFALEFAPGGELLRSLDLYNKLPPDVTKFYLTEIFMALEHIHEMGFAYRDLKPENVCIDEEGHVKLVDFGSCIRFDHHASGKMYTICCQPQYLSPEQLNGKHSGGYTKVCDWWTFGVLAYEISVGHTPFCEAKDTQYEVLLKILKNKINFPSHFEPRAKHFITALLNAEIKCRLVDIKTIKEHEYFDNVKHWENVRDKRLNVPFVPEMCRPGDSHYYVLNEEKSSKSWMDNMNLEASIKMF